MCIKDSGYVMVPWVHVMVTLWSDPPLCTMFFMVMIEPDVTLTYYVTATSWYV